MPQKFDEDYTHYQLDRSPLRKFVRRIYLRKAASLVTGPALDFGCGVGELLKRLPSGSKGVEYNQASIQICRDRGLEVEFYDGFADNWSLSTLPSDWKFETLVISHVLEHFEGPMEILAPLLAAAQKRGIRRALIIVPGKAGFKIDETHRTLVDLDMIRAANLDVIGWHITNSGYFPGSIKKLGNIFPHHELQCVLENR